MTSFVIISANNRLHYLVDGINNCRPLNSAITLSISTGKILTSENGVKYQYNIAGEDSFTEEPKRFSHLLSNQLSLHRRKFNIEDQLINIFLIENPIDSNEYEIDRVWVEEIEKIYDQGMDRSINLFRVVFSYNPQQITSINEQFDREVLRRLLRTHSDRTKLKANYLDEYILFIDNQDSNAAAISLGNTDHDFMMPRFLMDIMSAISNDNDSYNVRNAIIAGHSNNRCFSAGYAESMYYYPDIEDYFKHAERRDFYKYMLESDDQASTVSIHKEALNYDLYPIGLNTRKKNFASLYDNVPFDADIQNEKWSDSADKKINDMIKSLHDLIIGYSSFKSMKADLNTQDDYEVTYIDRDLIYVQLKFVEEEAKLEQCKLFKEQYERLLLDICTKEFYEYAKCRGDQENKQTSASSVQQTENKGCISFLFFWRKNKTVANKSIDQQVGLNNIQYTSIIDSINELMRLKVQFRQFCDFINGVESELLQEKQYCEHFKLSDHSHHYYPLINLDKLKRFHHDGFKSRMLNNLDEWEQSEPKSFNSLKTLIERAASNVTKDFQHIDWDHPVPFLVELPQEVQLHHICNQLIKLSAPFANYNISQAIGQSRVTKMLFSDRPNFEKEVDEMKKSELKNGLEINGYYSKHFVSKISMIQILPMDEAIIENLVKIASE